MWILSLKPSVVRQPTAFKFQKPSVMGKPTLFSDSLKKKDFPKSRSVPTTNAKKDLSKPVTAQILAANEKEKPVEGLKENMSCGMERNGNGRMRNEKCTKKTFQMKNAL
nr:hypothetical protein [Tanacetum cinerariifolium]